jgi:hypothetical protein
MTRHERLSLGISTAALVISIVSPFLNYYWFQNEVRVQQLKADSFVVHGYAYGCPDKKNIIFQVRLRNTGVWPIKNVRLTIQKTVSTFDPDHPDKALKFSFDKKDIDPAPPLPISIEEKSKDIIVQFKDPLMPMPYDVQLADLQIRNVPSGQIYVLPDMESLLPFVWASSEVSSFEVYWSFMPDCPTFERLRTAPPSP